MPQLQVVPIQGDLEELQTDLDSGSFIDKTEICHSHITDLPS